MKVSLSILLTSIIGLPLGHASRWNDPNRNIPQYDPPEQYPYRTADITRDPEWRSFRKGDFEKPEWKASLKSASLRGTPEVREKPSLGWGKNLKPTSLRGTPEVREKPSLEWGKNLKPTSLRGTPEVREEPSPEWANFKFNRTRSRLPAYQFAKVGDSFTRRNLGGLSRRGAMIEDPYGGDYGEEVPLYKTGTDQTDPDAFEDSYYGTEEQSRY